MTLASTDPFTFPLIDPAFLTTAFDVFAMTQVVKDVRTFVSSAPFQGLIAGPFGPMSTAQTDAQIAAAAKESVVTIWHPTSTARMSPKTASWGVVDNNLLVKGVNGLRIVDASVFVCRFILSLGKARMLIYPKIAQHLCWTPNRRNLHHCGARCRSYQSRLAVIQ